MEGEAEAFPFLYGWGTGWGAEGERRLLDLFFLVGLKDTIGLGIGAAEKDIILVDLFVFEVDLIALVNGAGDHLGAAG